MEPIKKQSLVENFNKQFSGTPRIFLAPGRVNLIGEHTDYNDGYVFPIALEMCTKIAAQKRDDKLLRIFSDKMDEIIEIDLSANPNKKNHWSDYVVGVAVQLLNAGIKISGADLSISSDVPVGAGLSSSAALEVATAFALTSLNGYNVDKTTMAQLCQKAENEFVGMKCGIMDQFIACYGETNKALFLDCRSLNFNMITLPSDGARFIICNTMVKHELGASEYNKRREECEVGVKLLSEHLNGINALRDVSVSDFKKYEAGLPDVVRRRSRHVVTEINRVEQSVKALQDGDLTQFGELMNASHFSLRDDYEVSCKELDTMVDIALSLPGVLGARMTGGGFGGCTVNLVKAENVDSFISGMKARYEEATGLVPEIYVSSPADGVREE